MRVATIDLGTNTALLLVAESKADHPDGLVPLEERATIVRLGQGVDKTRRFAPEAIERTLACLKDYATVIRSYGATEMDIVGTSAMRDAAGAEPLHEFATQELGTPIRVISGDEEAHLTFDGALSGLSVTRGDPIVVFDIGGGSTEIVHGMLSAEGASIGFAKSFDLGSVRLTERFLASDPPTAAELDAVARYVSETLAAISLKPSRQTIGIAGTMTTLAAIALEMEPYESSKIHGCRMSTDMLRHVTRSLALMTLDQRRNVTGLDPKRADVIVSGGMIAVGVVEQLGSASVMVSDRGVRWGLARKLFLTRQAPRPPRPR